MTDQDASLELFTVVEAPLDALHENPTNPRTITTERLNALAQAIDADRMMLLARPVIAQADGTILAGNMRHRAAQQLGWDSIPTIYVDLDDQRAREWLLRDNNAYGEWDDTALADLLRGLQADGADLALTGFDPSTLAGLLEDPGVPDDLSDDVRGLALARTTLDDPDTEVHHGDVWTVLDQHVLVVAGVFDGHHHWIPHVTPACLFVPYPTPMLPLTERAAGRPLVMVQPDLYLAGHLLDRCKEVRGEESVTLTHRPKKGSAAPMPADDPAPPVDPDEA